MKKRVTISAILVAMMVVCSACGGDNAEDIAGQVTALESESASVTTDEATQENTAPEESEVADAEEEETPLSLGRLQGGVYTNKYVGMECELDSSWQFYSAEELQALPENVTELMEGTELGDSIQNITQIMDMQAECTSEMTSMNVLYQKMDAQQRLASSILSDDQIIDGVLSESDSLIESYAQAGIEVVDISKKTVNFLGEERVALLTKGAVQGVDYFILQLFDYTLGEYSVTITFSSFMEDKTEQLAAMFYAI